MSQRQSYARYHYQEAMRLLDDFRAERLKGDGLLYAIHGPDEESRNAFDLFLMQAGAHTLACVLSVHSMLDVIAYAIYVVGPAEFIQARRVTTTADDAAVDAAVIEPTPSHLSALP